MMKIYWRNFQRFLWLPVLSNLPIIVECFTLRNSLIKYTTDSPDIHFLIVYRIISNEFRSAVAFRPPWILAEYRSFWRPFRGEPEIRYFPGVGATGIENYLINIIGYGELYCLKVSNLDALPSNRGWKRDHQGCRAWYCRLRANASPRRMRCLDSP